MSLTSGASTQPFSDSPELQRRLDEAAATAHIGRPDGPGDRAPAPAPATVISGSTEPARPVSTARERQELNKSAASLTSIDELDEALRRASITSLPDARLILAHHRHQRTTDPAVAPLPHTLGRRDLFGVVQRTQDVCFTLCIPFQDSPGEPPPRRFIQSRLTCQIYYDPASDDCVIVNKSVANVFLTGLCPDQPRNRLRIDTPHVVQPGTWRISLAHGGDSADHVLVDFLILRRQFTVSIHEAPGLSLASSSRKRCAVGDEDLKLKKRKKEGDVTEILLAAAPDGPADSGAETTSMIHTPARDLVRSKGTPLLDLSRGEVAVIRGPHKSQSDSDPVDQQGGGGSASYELRRLERIAETPSASLFTGEHSRLPGNVVAKVVKYTSKTAIDLVKCARSWQQEKTVLEKLHHANIISLKAFDGRLFAMYVERLPASLSRGDSSPLAPHESLTILRDVASALAYIVRHGFVHNDIKPANIAYSPERGAVLLDFGLATASSAPAMLGGTPWYVPPDLITRQTRGAPGDIWALGVTMLYVCGRMKLAERAARGWLIRDVTMENSDARRLMMKWLDVVQQAKEALTSSDRVESLVCKMLEPEMKLRIDAARIVAALADAPS